MLKTPNPHPPQLQAPGMGLPKHELFIARILVGLKLRTTTQENASEIFALEAKKILSIAEQTDAELASQRVLIDRLRGLEDSSRYWSLYMTMQHLCIVNRSTIDVIKSLNQGIRPEMVASTAAVKPKDDADQAVIPLFCSICAEFQATFPSDKTFETRTTFAHPWFGELNARQWHFFAGFHMSLHRRQVEKIAEKLVQN
jgi:hypothetical protein